MESKIQMSSIIINTNIIWLQFKTYSGQNAGQKFVTNMVKEGKY